MDSESPAHDSLESVYPSTPERDNGPKLRCPNTFEFLQTILPEHGIHYLALFKEGYKFPAHKVYTDLETMASAIDNMASSSQLSIYHACASYKKAVIEIEDGEKTKRKYRIPENWDRAKAFWVDLDCGQEKFDKGDGYLTKTDAVSAIDTFCAAVDWPMPMLVDSGNGIHAYWPLKEEIPFEEWVTVATCLKATLRHFGVIADPSRTADFASILRPAGSVNRKYGEAKAVFVIRGGTPADPKAMAVALEMYMVRSSVTPFKDNLNMVVNLGLNDDLTSHLKGVEGQESIEVVRSALRHLDPGMPREQWLTVIWAIRHGLGDTPEALELADTWSMGGIHA